MGRRNHVPSGRKEQKDEARSAIHPTFSSARMVNPQIAITGRLTISSTNRVAIVDQEEVAPRSDSLACRADPSMPNTCASAIAGY